MIILLDTVKRRLAEELFAKGVHHPALPFPEVQHCDMNLTEVLLQHIICDIDIERQPHHLLWTSLFMSLEIPFSLALVLTAWLLTTIPDWRGILDLLLLKQILVIGCLEATLSLQGARKKHFGRKSLFNQEIIVVYTFVFSSSSPCVVSCALSH